MDAALFGLEARRESFDVIDEIPAVLLGKIANGGVAQAGMI